MCLGLVHTAEFGLVGGSTRPESLRQASFS